MVRESMRGDDQQQNHMFSYLSPGTLFAGQTGASGGAAVLPDGSNINPIALTLLQMKLPSGGFLVPTPQVIDPSKPFASQGFLRVERPLHS
jgi:hypothetical protein